MGVLTNGVIGFAVLLLTSFIVIKTPFWEAFDDTGNGYGARLACGGVYGSNRRLESVLGSELTFPPVRFGRTFDLDDSKKCVTVRGKWPLARNGATACYASHRQGCYLLSKEDIENTDVLLKKNIPENRSDHSRKDLPWPLGNKKNQDRIDAVLNRVDYNALDKVVSDHFSNTELHARALVLLVDGEIVYEQYGDECDATTRLLGWSATKSLLNALIGVRIAQGGITLETSIAELLPQWKGYSHLKSLTIRQALNMQDGLDVDEVYFPGSPITHMLFVNGSVNPIIEKAKSGRRPRGEGCFHYSSATTNILCQALSASFTNKDDQLSHTTNFFKDLGVDTFRLETDVNGNCLGSSFGWATARDWARLGLLYMYDGFWWDIETIIPDSHDRTKQILPNGWVDFTKTPVKTSNGVYGAQFWLGGNNTALLDDDTISARHREKECDEIFPTRLSPSRDWMKHLPNGSFFMHGFEEQAVIIHQGEPKTGKPSFVLVRLGATKEKVLKWDKSKFYRDIFDSIH